ncbi:potassium transporter [Corchorus olitorius]|uniref:Potassium transporter n=1 Tax=Corchorus olitorius TaxID=93759 RepID=A0A1R3IH06_9ROSI|nr:potassium transporter [Corchorus olitorius]
MSNGNIRNPLEATGDHDEGVTVTQDQLMERKNSFQKFRRFDSLDMEKLTAHHDRGSKSIGVIYGDIGTSPLYVYASTFPDGIKHNDDILGVLSMIFYTFTLIPLIKYVLIVLRANDNGEGGTFALYSLICRYARVGLIPTQQAEDADVSNFQLELRSNRLKRASKLKSNLEKSNFAKFFLLIITMLGTSMVIGDGILTPSISVLSAVGGLKEATSSMTEGRIVGTSIAILILLFMVQRFGTDKVGYTFAPIICIWFSFIGGIGVYNFIKFDPTVAKALNPAYIVQYFRRNKIDAWVSLGGVVLAITGTEALFADVGHFSVRSVQISMCTVTYPALILAYTGQASFLRKHNDFVADIFFKSIPVAASIIASQAMISGTFSIIQQSLALGCFPRVKVVHTSTTYEGQVYIPEINYLLMLACVGVTAGFKTTQKIGNAYAILMTVMYIWNSVYRKKYYYELDHKISSNQLKEITVNTNFSRIPGLAMFYSELVHGIPPIFEHYLAHVSALHSVLVFVSIKSLPISKIPLEERFHFRRAEPRELNLFRCVVRYGYTDVQNDGDSFENTLMERLKEFIKEDTWLTQRAITEKETEIMDEGVVGKEDEHELQERVVNKEIEMVDNACEAGIVHLVGENEVVAAKGAGLGKKILIDYAFNFIKRNLRQTDKVFEIPHKRLLKVGMTYEL